MKTKIISAEWNPENEVVLNISDCQEDGMLVGKKTRLTLDNITEDQATPEVVESRMIEMGYELSKWNRQIN